MRAIVVFLLCTCHPCFCVVAANVWGGRKGSRNGQHVLQDFSTDLSCSVFAPYRNGQ